MLIRFGLYRPKSVSIILSFRINDLSYPLKTHTNLVLIELLSDGFTSLLEKEDMNGNEEDYERRE